MFQYKSKRRKVTYHKIIRKTVKCLVVSVFMSTFVAKNEEMKLKIGFLYLKMIYL